MSKNSKVSHPSQHLYQEGAKQQGKLEM